VQRIIMPATLSGVTDLRETPLEGRSRGNTRGRGLRLMRDLDDEIPRRSSPEGAVQAHGALPTSSAWTGRRRGKSPSSQDHHALGKARKSVGIVRFDPTPYSGGAYPRRPDPDAAARARRGRIIKASPPGAPRGLSAPPSTS